MLSAAFCNTDMENRSGGFISCRLSLFCDQIYDMSEQKRQRSQICLVNVHFCGNKVIYLDVDSLDGSQERLTDADALGGAGVFFFFLDVQMINEKYMVKVILMKVTT